MCLGVPGRIIEVADSAEANAASRVGTVDFQGSTMQVALATTPEAKVGDWVLVHAGFALTVLDEEGARETWKYLKDADLVDDIPAEMKSE